VPAHCGAKWCFRATCDMHLRARYLMRLTDVPAATGANVKHHNRVRFDGKQHTVLMWFVTIKDLTYFKRNVGIFRGEHAAFGHLGE